MPNNNGRCDFHNLPNNNFIEKTIKEFDNHIGELICSICMQELKDCGCAETEISINHTRSFIRQALEKQQQQFADDLIYLRGYTDDAFPEEFNKLIQKYN